MRRAVSSVISATKVGYPEWTSARTPKAVTVWNPRAGFEGWPLTYLNAYRIPSLVGMSSMTPAGEWEATLAVLSKSGQRRKSSAIDAVMPAMIGSAPCVRIHRTVPATSRNGTEIMSSTLRTGLNAINRHFLR